MSPRSFARKLIEISTRSDKAGIVRDCIACLVGLVLLGIAAHLIGNPVSNQLIKVGFVVLLALASLNVALALLNRVLERMLARKSDSLS